MPTRRTVVYRDVRLYRALPCWYRDEAVFTPAMPCWHRVDTGQCWRLPGCILITWQHHGTSRERHDRPRHLHGRVTVQVRYSTVSRRRFIGLYRGVPCLHLGGGTVWLPASTVLTPGSAVVTPCLTVWTPGSVVLIPWSRRADSVVYRSDAGAYRVTTVL